MSSKVMRSKAAAPFDECSIVGTRRRRGALYPLLKQAIEETALSPPSSNQVATRPTVKNGHLFSGSPEPPAA